jgi:peptide/nickel transport system substrate-binding protein
VVNSRWTVGLVIALLSIVVASSGSFAGNTSRSYVAAAQAETTIVFGTTDSVEESLDPAQSYDYFGWQIIQALGQGLVEIAPGSQAGLSDIRPALATSWAVSADGKTWDFTLRQGVTWQNGWPFNASCVKWSFDRNMGKRSMLEQIDGPQLNIGYGDIIDSITVTGTYSVRFNLKIAFAPFLQLMSCAPSYIVSPTHKDDTDYVHYNAAAGVNASNPMGLGPYILTQWERTGGTDTAMRLVANPNYWNTSLPRTKNITINFYQTDPALVAALLSGAIDVAYRHLTPGQVDLFRNNADYHIWEGPEAAIQYMLFQQTMYPYNETLVRQGIAAALNRTMVAQSAFQGTFDPLYSVIPAAMAFHKDSFDIYGDANYTFTQYALGQFGYNESHKLIVDLYYESSGHYPSSESQAGICQWDLEASGVITVNLHGLEWTTFRQQRNAGTMPVFIYGWYPDYTDADDYAFLPFASWLNMGFNATYPAAGVQEYNLWTEGRSTLANSARQAAYYTLQDLQAEQCSLVPLWQGKSIAVSSAHIDNVILDITTDWYFALLTIGQPSTTTTTPISTTTPTTTTTATTTTPTSTIGPTTTTNATGFVLDLRSISIAITIGAIVVMIVGTILICRRPREM